MYLIVREISCLCRWQNIGHFQAVPLEFMRCRSGLVRILGPESCKCSQQGMALLPLPSTLSLTYHVPHLSIDGLID